MKSGPFIIPASLRVKDRIEMYENEGAYCPCYESREKLQTEGRDSVLADVVLSTYCGCNELLQNLQELERHVERGCWRMNG